MSITIKRVCIFLAVQACTAFLAWSGGYNFDERGLVLAMTLLFSGAVGVLLATFPE